MTALLMDGPEPLEPALYPSLWKRPAWDVSPGAGPLRHLPDPQILAMLWCPPIQHPKSVGVNLQKIIPDTDVTFNLFDEPRRVKIDSVVDRLNRRFGWGTVTSEQTLRATQYLSHERIPFGKP